MQGHELEGRFLEHDAVPDEVLDDDPQVEHQEHDAGQVDEPPEPLRGRLAA